LFAAEGLLVKEMMLCVSCSVHVCLEHNVFGNAKEICICLLWSGQGTKSQTQVASFSELVFSIENCKKR